MTAEQIMQAKARIDEMTQQDMAQLVRFARAGHPFFDRRNGDLADYFQEKFRERGGMTPEISKAIGWGR